MTNYTNAEDYNRDVLGISEVEDDTPAHVLDPERFVSEAEWNAGDPERQHTVESIDQMEAEFRAWLR